MPDHQDRIEHLERHVRLLKQENADLSSFTSRPSVGRWAGSNDTSR